MKSLLRTILVALVLGLAVAPTISRAANQRNIENRVTRLDALVKLSPEQKARATEIFKTETAALDAFPTAEDRALKGSEARVASRTQIRALLTPEQRKKYDVAPQRLGGGLPVDPENMAEDLSKTVALTADQKAKALQFIWDDLVDQIAALPDNQPFKGFTWRQPLRDHVRAILTPAQQARFDVTPPYTSTKVGSSTSFPETLVERLSQIVSLTAEQKPTALQIFQNYLANQAVPENRPPNTIVWRQSIRDQLRVILTPEQQAKFDVTSPYRQSGPAGAKSGG